MISRILQTVSAWYVTATDMPQKDPNDDDDENE